MDKQFLSDQLDYVQARIEEIDEKVINNNPSDKGYKELIDSYNKWVDRYNELLIKIETIDDEDLDKRKLDIESDKNTILYEIEQRKIDLKREKFLFDREKFQNEVQTQKFDRTADIVFKTLDIGTKVSVPIIGGYFAMKLAILAYTKNGELELRDGTIWSLIKQIKV